MPARHLAIDEVGYIVVSADVGLAEQHRVVQMTRKNSNVPHAQRPIGVYSYSWPNTHIHIHATGQ